MFPALLYLVAFLVATAAPTVSLPIYARPPVLYFLTITVLRHGRTRNQEYANLT